MRLPEEGSKQRANRSASSAKQATNNGGWVHWGEEAALADGGPAGVPAMRTGRPSRMR